MTTAMYHYPVGRDRTATWPIWYNAADASIKRTVEQQHDSPPKELPTKMSKYKRMKERRLTPPSSMMMTEEERAERNSKCAGTQTSFSFPRDSYPMDIYPHARDGYPVMELDGRSPIQSLPSHLPYYHPLPHANSYPLPPSRASPPRPLNHSPPIKEEDPESGPLNLSVSNGSISVKDELAAKCRANSQTISYTFQVPRPSVITIAPPSPGSRSPGVCSSDSLENHAESSAVPVPPRPRTHTEESFDNSIEEHFRRSLGMEYPRLVPPQRTPSPEPCRSPPSAAPSSPTHNATEAMAASTTEPVIKMSIMGAVDDHFAKSLGATWTQIKAKEALEEEPGSVDDHFAKALGGETWRRICAERERRTSSSSSMQSTPSTSPRISPASQMIL